MSGEATLSAESDVKQHLSGWGWQKPKPHISDLDLTYEAAFVEVRLWACNVSKQN